MAITKERLEELIEQKAKIYGISKNNNVFCVGLKLKNQAMCLLNPNNYKKTDWYKKQIEVYSKFYETKEEVEFVQKFHTSKTVYFKPPTWEEFLKTEHYDFHAQKKTMPTIINIYSKYIYVEDFKKVHLILDLSKENYYKAVEYAKKLFLGEEEC